MSNLMSDIVLRLSAQRTPFSKTGKLMEELHHLSLLRKQLSLEQLHVLKQGDG